MMKDQDWERLVETMKDQHHPPREVPRDRMWQRIEAQRKTRRARIITPRVWRMAFAAAAVLVLGIAIGRWTLPALDPGHAVPDQLASRQAPVVPDDPASEPPISNKPKGGSTSNLLYRKAASDLFGRADVLLTDFKVTPCAEQDFASVPDWAGGMLLQTRLLMNTPLAQDRELESLFLDLELVLAQIVGLDKENCARDVGWIRDAMARKSTLERLRMLGPDPAVGKAL